MITFGGIERIEEKSATFYLNIYQHLSRLKKTMKRLKIFSVQAKIPTEHLRSTNQERYLWGQLWSSLPLKLAFWWMKTGQHCASGLNLEMVESRDILVGGHVRMHIALVYSTSLNKAI